MIEIDNPARRRIEFRELARAVAILGFAGLILAGPALAQTGATPVPGSLRAVLGALAQKHGIAVHGLETVDEQPAPVVDGTPLRRIGQLLADHNDMLVQKPGGGVETVMIMGRKRRIVPPPDDIDVETSRSPSSMTTDNRITLSSSR